MRGVQPSPRSRAGYTLIEAVTALSIVVMAGSAILLSSQTMLTDTNESVRRTIAAGMAQQLLDEITCKRYMEVGQSSTGSTLFYETGEAPGASTPGRRVQFDDTDDFNTYTIMPAVGRYGESLGTGDDAGGERNSAFRIPTTFFSRWRQRAEVYYVNATNLNQRLTPVSGSTAAASVSGVRAVEVWIDYVDADGTVRTLANRRRVNAYLPPPS